MEPTTADSFTQEITLAVQELVHDLRESKHAKILQSMGFGLIKVASPDDAVSDECIFFANDFETVAVDELGSMWHVASKVDLTRLQFTDVSQKLQSIMDKLPPAKSDQ